MKVARRQKVLVRDYQREELSVRRSRVIKKGAKRVK